MASSNTCQQFNLRWNNHTNNILQVFMEQLTAETLVDVTLSCQGKFLKAHKMVLSACSPYFEELFRLHQVPHPVIIINGMKFFDVKLIVEFMYKGEIKVQESDLAGVLLGAETLQVKGLSSVRNKYEKGQIKTVETTEENRDSTSSLSPKVSSPNDSFKMKKRIHKASTDEETPKTTEVVTNQKDIADGNPKISSQPNTGTSTDVDQIAPGMSLLKSKINSVVEDDDDLPALIKVEPPDIRDIDEEEPYAGWESPRLVIDMDTKNVELIQPKIPMKAHLRHLEFTSAHIELTDEKIPQSGSSDKTVTYKDASGIVTSPPKVRCRIPRPPNAFMIFANEWRRKLAYQNPMESNKEISVRLGVMWKNLNSDAKEAYYSASRKADEDHKRKYPGYYYSPKEARIRKTLKLSRRVSSPSPSMDALHLVKVYMSDDKNEQTCPIILSKSMKKHRTILPKPEGQSADSTDMMEVEEEEEEEIRLETEEEEEVEEKVENGDDLIKSE